jgi:hypothetical protein
MLAKIRSIPYGATCDLPFDVSIRSQKNFTFMPKLQLDINRALTGILAAVLLTSGFGLMFAGIGSEMMHAGFIRTGLVLGALWLALPTRNRPAAWEDVTWTGVCLALIGVLVFLSARLRWTVIPLALAVGIAVYFLRRPLKRG